MINHFHQKLRFLPFPNLMILCDISYRNNTFWNPRNQSASLPYPPDHESGPQSYTALRYQHDRRSGLIVTALLFHLLAVSNREQDGESCHWYYTVMYKNIEYFSHNVHMTICTASLYSHIKHSYHHRWYKLLLLKIINNASEGHILYPLEAGSPQLYWLSMQTAQTPCAVDRTRAMTLIRVSQ
jgi:hypothetical protein